MHSLSEIVISDSFSVVTKTGKVELTSLIPKCRGRVQAIQGWPTLYKQTTRWCELHSDGVFHGRPDYGHRRKQGHMRAGSLKWLDGLLAIQVIFEKKITA